MIVFHNIYKTLCPQQELTFGVNAQLQPKLQEKKFYNPGWASAPNWPDLCGPHPEPRLTFGKSQCGNQGGSTTAALWNPVSRKLSGQCCQWGAEGLSSIRLGTHLLLGSLCVHVRSRDGIISLGKHSVI